MSALRIKGRSARDLDRERGRSPAAGAGAGKGLGRKNWGGVLGLGVGVLRELGGSHAGGLKGPLMLDGAAPVLLCPESLLPGSAPRVPFVAPRFPFKFPGLPRQPGTARLAPAGAGKLTLPFARRPSFFGGGVGPITTQSGVEGLNVVRGVLALLLKTLTGGSAAAGETLVEVLRFPYWSHRTVVVTTNEYTGPGAPGLDEMVVVLLMSLLLLAPSIPGVTSVVTVYGGDEMLDIAGGRSVGEI